MRRAGERSRATGQSVDAAAAVVVADLKRAAAALNQLRLRSLPAVR